MMKPFLYLVVFLAVIGAIVGGSQPPTPATAPASAPPVMMKFDKSTEAQAERLKLMNKAVELRVL